VPEFTVIPRGKRCIRPARLRFPILVKTAEGEASLRISQASFVETDEQFKERVQFIHEKHNNDVIARNTSPGANFIEPAGQSPARGLPSGK